MGMLPEIETRYPEGSDITIMNTYYQYPLYNEGKKINDDFIAIVYKNNETKKKEYKIIMKPNYTYYKLKEGEQVPNYNKLFIERDKVDEVTVPFKELEYTIAKQHGLEAEYVAAVRNHDRESVRKLHTATDIFFSDANIEDHYRFKFANTYKNDICKLNKGFFDIEVDGKWAKNDFVEMGECAINCVSFHNNENNTTYTFILRDSRNPQIAELEKEYSEGIFNEEEIRKFVIEKVGGEEQAKKYGLIDTHYKLYFFDYEIELLKSLFFTMHKCSPDFIEGWNSSAFDIEYIIQRIRNLGYDPVDIMCDQTWPALVVKNYVDQKNVKEAKLAERGDYTFISGLPVFIDQMIQYASRRKSKIGSFKSFKLDDIGLKEAKVQKLDYHHITNNITELPWLAFKTFVLYNIMDVTVQKCIEAKTNDLEYIFAKCVVNNTVYQKGHRQTVYLINRMASDWYKKGFIRGNNTNFANPKPPKFLGALVGDPTHTNDFSKLKIDGRAIWVCDNLQDYDYKSLYPSILGEFNIAPNTQIGRINIPNKVYEHENLYNIEADKYSRGGEFIENLVTDNIIEYCHRWFHLPNISEFIEDIDEFYSKSNLGNFTNLVSAGFGDGKARSVLLPTVDDKHCPVRFNQPKVHRPITFYNKRDPKINYDDLMIERTKKNNGI